MKSSKKLQISSHLLFVYINDQDRKWRMSVLVFFSALVHSIRGRRLCFKEVRLAFQSPFPAPPKSIQTEFSQGVQKILLMCMCYLCTPVLVLSDTNRRTKNKKMISVNK